MRLPRGKERLPNDLKDMLREYAVTRVSNLISDDSVPSQSRLEASETFRLCDVAAEKVSFFLCSA